MSPNTQYLQTVSTPHPGVYEVYLHLSSGPRRIGQIDFNGEPTYYTTRTKAHLHYKSQSLAVNVEVLKRFNIVWVCVEYSGEMLWSPTEHLFNKGFYLKFKGYEPQIFMKLSDWGKEKSQFKRNNNTQGDFFEAA